MSTDEFKTMLGIMFSKNEGSMTSAFGKEESVLNKAAEFKRLIGNILLDLNQFEISQKAINEKIRMGANGRGFASYWDFQDLIFKNAIELLWLKDTTIEKVKIFKAYHHFVEIHKAIESENYGLIVTHAIKLIDENKVSVLKNEKQFDLISSYLTLKKNNDRYSNLNDKGLVYINTIKDHKLKGFETLIKLNSNRLDSFFFELDLAFIKMGLDTIINSQSDLFLTKLSRYGSFISDVMKADNNKALSEVIMSYSAPAGSYKIKRNHRFSIAFNGYIGGFAAYENENPSFIFSKNDKFKNSIAIGFTAPVGLTFAFGARKGSEKTDFASQYLNRRGKVKYLNKNHNYGLSLIFFDLIAPVSFRLGNSTETPLPQEVRFEQFFAPGLLYHHSIGNSPIVWFLGGQYYPSLRTFNNNSDMSNVLTVRTGLMFDIPFFYMYKKELHNHKDRKWF
jgi:hypothetical protein